MTIRFAPIIAEARLIKPFHSSNEVSFMDEFISVFMREEVTPYIRKMICDKIFNRTSIIIETINLNRYNIIIDFENNTVLIDEITFIEFAESRKMSISEFSEIINC